VSDVGAGRTTLQVEVVHGGRPDEQTMAALEQAVRCVLERGTAHPARRAPAWGRAARLEATITGRIATQVALAGTVRG
jgi:hypothetical protein